MQYVLSLRTAAQMGLARLHGFMSVAVTTLHLIPGPVTGAAALAWLSSSLLKPQELVLAFVVVVSKPALPQFREPASPHASSRLPLPVIGEGDFPRQCGNSITELLHEICAFQDHQNTTSDAKLKHMGA